MLRYIIRRVLWAIFVLLIVVFITYMIFFLLPSGDPAVRLAGKNQTPQLLAQIRAAIRPRTTRGTSSTCCS